VRYYPDSKVEVQGFEARHYDFLMNLITLGGYSRFIKNAVKSVEIKPGEKILDLGAGTGRNACLMKNYFGPEGELVGLDISEEMIVQFRKNCKEYSNVRIEQKRIDRDLGYNDYFDKAFISFVLHGFPQKVREDVVSNAYTALKPGGEFCILDYSEFELKDMPFYARIPFKAIECTYAFDYIKKDWKTILRDKGFTEFKEVFFWKGFVRLLKARK